MANPFKVPLNALRAIEIVGRGGTLSRAADELGVTPGAVSQHIRRAEERLGYVLFERDRAGLRPTPALDAALPHLQRGFQALAEAVTAIEQSHTGRLTLSAAPAFAARWLVQRLGRFTRENPDIEIRFVASVALADLNHSDIDCAIRLGRGHWPDLQAECLLPQPFFPVASPEWRASLTAPSDLAAVPIIHDEGTMVDWRDWFAAAGTPMPELSGPSFSDPVLALEAAMAGQGVMLAWDMVVADALALGRLIRPFEIEVESRLAYWFVTTEASSRSHKVRLFRDWLKREIAASSGRPALVVAPPILTRTAVHVIPGRGRACRLCSRPVCRRFARRQGDESVFPRRQEMCDQRVGMAMAHAMVLLQHGDEVHVPRGQVAAQQRLPFGDRAAVFLLYGREIGSRSLDGGISHVCLGSGSRGEPASRFGKRSSV